MRSWWRSTASPRELNLVALELTRRTRRRSAPRRLEYSYMMMCWLTSAVTKREVAPLGHVTIWFGPRSSMSFVLRSMSMTPESSRLCSSGSMSRRPTPQSSVRVVARLMVLVFLPRPTVRSAVLGTGCSGACCGASWGDEPDERWPRGGGGDWLRSMGRLAPPRGCSTLSDVDIRATNPWNWDGWKHG